MHAVYSDAKPQASRSHVHAFDTLALYRNSFPPTPHPTLEDSVLLQQAFLSYSWKVSRNTCPCRGARLSLFREDRSTRSSTLLQRFFSSREKQTDGRERERERGIRTRERKRCSSVAVVRCLRRTTTVSVAAQLMDSRRSSPSCWHSLSLSLSHCAPFACPLGNGNHLHIWRSNVRAFREGRPNSIIEFWYALWTGDRPCRFEKNKEKRTRRGGNAKVSDC